MKSSLALGVGNRRGERGQTTIFVVLALALFLLGFTGLAVDYTNLWFHRQSAQAAADAACQAGAMDMLALSQGTTISTTFNPNFTPTSGAMLDCSANPNATPCWYAARNGYNGAGLGADASNSVSFSFPPSISGITPPLTSLAPVPFMRVDVVDRVRVYLSALITGSRTQDVRAVAKCGLVQTTSPIPILVLHPTMPQSFSFIGNPTIAIIGGPTKSIQVNSSSTGAVSYPWGSGQVDLSQGGPPPDGSPLGTPGTGSQFGMWGGASGPPCSSPCKNWNDGSTGSWSYPSPPVLDPFANLPVPAVPANGTTQTVCVKAGACGATVTAVDPGCPAVPPNTCVQYSHGSYAGISVKHENAVFLPGIYYLTGDLVLDVGSVVRPSALAGDGTGGAMFYFAGNAGIDVKGNSGGGWGTITQYDPYGAAPIQCTGGPLPAPALPKLDGNIFLGPCTGTYGDPLGQYRGMVFFRDRTTAPDNLDMHGNGGLLIAGNMYFHQTTGFNNALQLLGATGSDTRILGDIVVDQLQLGGGGTITMELNPNAAFPILKVALLQ